MSAGCNFQHNLLVFMSTPWFEWIPMAAACAVLACTVATLLVRWRAEDKRERQQQEHQEQERPEPPRPRPQPRPVPPGRMVAGRHSPRPRRDSSVM